MTVCMLDYCHDVYYVRIFCFIYCTAVVIGQRNALYLTLEKGWNLITNKVSQCYATYSFVHLRLSFVFTFPSVDASHSSAACSHKHLGLLAKHRFSRRE